MIALDAGPFVRVIWIDPTHTYSSPPFFASAVDLIPQPMVYFHGQVPN